MIRGPKVKVLFALIALAVSAPAFGNTSIWDKYLGTCYTPVSVDGTPIPPAPTPKWRQSYVFSGASRYFVDGNSHEKIPAIIFNLKYEGSDFYRDAFVFLDRGRSWADKEGDHFEFQGRLASAFNSQFQNTSHFRFDASPRADGLVVFRFYEQIDWDGQEQGKAFDCSYLVAPAPCDWPH